jgi:hypothetical protein
LPTSPETFDRLRHFLAVLDSHLQGGAGTRHSRIFGRFNFLTIRDRDATEVYPNYNISRHFSIRQDSNQKMPFLLTELTQLAQLGGHFEIRPRATMSQINGLSGRKCPF